MLISKLTTCLFILLPIPGICQFLTNPDMEGPRGASLTPPGWDHCQILSSPDTQPGSWNNHTRPSSGSSFAGLVTRGNLGPYANTTEDMQGKFVNSLLANHHYNIKIDLVLSNAEGEDIGWGDWLSYGNSVKLNVYLSATPCDKSTPTWTSPVIDNTSWKTFDFDITPDTNFNYIILEAAYAADTTYFGNIGIDHIVIRENPTGVLLKDGPCTVKTFNLFTPNQDGYNDEFFIETSYGNWHTVKMQICNQWGDEVFSSEDIYQTWNGDRAATGIYYWNLHYSCTYDDKLYQNHLKGWVNLVR